MFAFFVPSSSCVHVKICNICHIAALFIHVLPSSCFRYASLYFCCAVEDQDNELITLEIIHRYVELLDKYFGSVSLKRLTCNPLIESVRGPQCVIHCFQSGQDLWSAAVCVVASQVCELDIIFNFEKAYFILDEFLLGGEAQETSKKNVLKAIEQADLLQEVRMFLYHQVAEPIREIDRRVSWTVAGAGQQLNNIFTADDFSVWSVKCQTIRRKCLPRASLTQSL